MMQLILASGSKRRQELLEMLDVEFDVVVSDIEEVLDETLPIEEAVIDLARQKASAVAREYRDVAVLGCDTVVSINDVILGKPKDEIEAFSMLKQLSGETHRVITGCSFIVKGEETTFFRDALVTFDNLSDDEIKRYIETEEPYDKAGGYGIQGRAAKFINQISGDYYTVMGLPIRDIYLKCVKRIVE